MSLRMSVSLCLSVVPVLYYYYKLTISRDKAGRGNGGAGHVALFSLTVGCVCSHSCPSDWIEAFVGGSVCAGSASPHAASASPHVATRTEKACPSRCFVVLPGCPAALLHRRPPSSFSLPRYLPSASFGLCLYLTGCKDYEDGK